MSEFSDVRQAISEHNLEEARELLREYIKEEPDSAEVWYLASQAALNETQRRAFLEKAVEIDPLHAYAANELHDLLHPRSEASLSEALVTVKSNDFDIQNTKTDSKEGSISPRYADLGQRFGAFMLDQIIMMVAILPIAYVSLVLLSSTDGSINQESIMRSWSITLAASVLIQSVYYAYFLTRREGQTIGKKMMNVRVIKRDGSALSIWDAILRSIIGYTLVILAFGIGFAWAAFDKQGQGWHDMIADTIVVEAS